MARKPPARVRAGLARMPRPYDRSPARVVPGVSMAAQRCIADFERVHGSPGAVGLAVAAWSKLVHGSRRHEPGSLGRADCPCCDDTVPRTLIEQALRHLPLRAARELRAVVRPLDAVFLDRVRPDPSVNDRQDWWTDLP
ncbi:hypothetical protein GCM10010193_48510 [Kitasatospora atroaurantiaca]|uniref:Uncharacterized protein n=1 Tax=Kitasatospora atroaurantiaca TaxID=285545 RepID=A0A561EYU1_9ACTN|nr:hypothetical protein [Kitasatospora atroaurantiaca]TWE20771.1 hypothetical protein FB465_5929 [Kitasatospora atroaurantiaca]